MDTPILSGRGLVGVAMTLLALGCNGGPTGPNAPDDGPLRIHPVLQTSIEAERLKLDAIGITIVETADGSMVSDTVLSYVGDPETVFGWVLELESLPATVRVEAEAWSGETRMFAGALETQVEDASPSTPRVIHDLDMAFVGPGADAVEIEVTPGDPLLTFGDTLRFQVTGRDENGDVVDDVLAFWSSSDPDLAPISPDALLEAPGERGSVRVEARTPKGLADDTGVAFQPSAASLVVVRGDGDSGPVESSVPLEVRVVGEDGEGVADVDVTFAAEDGALVADALRVSDEAGSAGTMGVLGPVAGDYIFTASAPGLEAVRMVVTAVAGPPAPGSATITASPTEVPADNDTQSQITVRLFDENGNPVTESGGTVVLATDLGDLTAVTDNADGTYTAFISSAVAGTATVTGTLDGEPIDDAATVTFTDAGGPGGPSTTFSTITASPTEVPADNDTQSEITVRLFDAQGNPVTESGGTVVLTTDLGDLTAVTDNADGSYTAFISSATTGTATVTGTLDGEAIDDSATVTFTDTGGPTEPVITSVDVTPTTATLNALGDTETFTAVALDENGAPMPGVTFTWSVGSETVATIDPATGVATAVGNGSTPVTATADGVSGTATLTVEQVAHTVTVDPTEVTLSASDGASSSGPASVTAPAPSEEQLTAEAFDANGNVIADASFAWLSLDPTVATVDTTGLVSAVSPGTTKIHVTSDGITAEATVTVQ